MAACRPDLVGVAADVAAAVGVVDVPMIHFVVHVHPHCFRV